MNVIKSVLDGNWQQLSSDVERLAASKVMERVADRKISVLSRINGVTEEAQREMMTPVTEPAVEEPVVA
jgi:hypothetical protein